MSFFSTDLLIERRSYPKHCFLRNYALRNSSLRQCALRGDYPYQGYQNGFTILEVMVALGILAVVTLTAMQAASSYTQAVNAMQTRTLAHFVAQNTLNDLRISQQWISTPQTQQVKSQGQSWQVTLTPSDTPVDSVKQIHISVAPMDEAGNVLHTITDLEGVLIKPVGRNP